MKTIWKYYLEVIESQTIMLPKKAEILTVQIQSSNMLQIWAIVDTDLEKQTESRTIQIYGTGHPINTKNTLKYISTVQLYNGSLVFHVFESVDGDLK